jgi:hypothetical protein
VTVSKNIPSMVSTALQSAEQYTNALILGSKLNKPLYLRAETENKYETSGSPDDNRF